MRTKFDIKNHKRWNWKTISIKKMIRKSKNNNKKNKNQIWYKNKMSMNIFFKKINKKFKIKYIAIDQIYIKINCKEMKF